MKKEAIKRGGSPSKRECDNSGWDSIRKNRDVYFNYRLLKRLRQERGVISNPLIWTQRSVAKKMEISRICYQRIENGIVSPSLQVISKIAKIFNIDSKALIMFEKEGINK